MSLTLAEDETYHLTVNKVDVGTNATEPDPEYLHKDGDEIPARNKFNDPVDAWAFDDGNRVRIPSDGIDSFGACLSLREDPEKAEPYETLGECQ